MALKVLLFFSLCRSWRLIRSLIGWLALSVFSTGAIAAKSNSAQRRVALCYVRLSYTRTGEDAVSPERQRANIETMLADSGLTLEWYEDVQGHRSGADTEHRPGWRALEHRLDDDDVDLIIANDLSRIHRRGWRIGQLIHRIQSNSKRLLLAAPGRQIDLSTPMGLMIVQFIAMVDEYYVLDARLRQQDNARRRREKGITTGTPPFGTYRGEGGFLKRTQHGAWYLPDASFVSGPSKSCPAPGALWHSFSECALKILTLYATTSLGYEKIAYQLQRDGWPFEDKRDQPRPVSGDDVRRVISNWPEYGGLIGAHRAKDRNAADLAQLDGVTFIEDRAVFPTDLLRAVALRQRKNKILYESPAHGVIKDAYAYPLRNILHCARCEEHARQLTDPTLRSRLGGTDQNGIKRYRHKSGVLCGGQARSVRCETVEAELLALLATLKPRAEVLTDLLQLAVRMSRGLKFKAVDATQQHQQALHRAERKINALHRQYRDGVLTEVDYTQQLAERQRTYTELVAQPVSAARVSFELSDCVIMLDRLDVLWNMSTPAHRQALAQNLFESITYDLDRQTIVAYSLTPWARTFLCASDAVGTITSSTDLEGARTSEL